MGFLRRNRLQTKMVPTLLLINTVVFLLWTFSLNLSIDPNFMADHFLISWSSLTEGRYWTLITSVFSHNMFLHFFMNMFVLNSFGPIIELLLGSKRFIIFYLIAGVISSLCHAMASAFLLHQPDLPALGASGAISGLILLFSLLFPKHIILILGLIPLPAVLGATLFVGLDIWGLIEQAGGHGLPIGHGAHLGGALTGILYFLWNRTELKFRRVSLGIF